ncbi:MAG TPA: hypothetical protein VF161_05020 [Steroidobacteraceae bacterium]|jgi:Flp pilus assembly protein TadB
MWLARPVYESLPYLYMLVGVALLAAAFLIGQGLWPSVLLALGALSVLAGLVVWLRRRDYRTRQAEYTNTTLDE